jgi:hypothetical protein
LPHLGIGVKLCPQLRNSWQRGRIGPLARCLGITLGLLRCLQEHYQLPNFIVGLHRSFCAHSAFDLIGRG